MTSRIPVALISLLFLVAQLHAADFPAAACDSDSHCTETFNAKYYCLEGKCVHESIFPTNLYEIFGLVLIVLISMLANLGGIGGGEVIVSVYIYFFQYSIREAVPLSKVTIFAGALLNFWVNCDRRMEGNPNAFLIDHKLISLIVPMMLAGTTVGVAFTNSFPSAVILILITTLVLKYTFNMTLKARKLYLLENAAGAQPLTLTKHGIVRSVIGLLTTLKRPTVPHLPADLPNDYQVLPQRDLFDEIKDEERKIRLRRSKKSFLELISKDKSSLCISLISLFVVLFCTFMRTNHWGSSVATTCSATGITLFFAAQLICFAMVQLSYRNNMQLLTNLTIGSIEGNKRFFRWIMWNSYVAGVLAGTLGMGGGIIINPMLIELGISPEISTAASSVVVLFTSLSTSSQFLMLGGISMSNVILVLLLSGCGAYMAAKYLDELIRAYKRPSILVWILAILLMVSSITIPIIGRIRIAQEANPFSFSSPC
jgi:uncharacterized membrane protein YfcA